MISNGSILIPPVPLMFFLDLTERCNLKCWFCYNDREPHHRKDAEYQDIKSILDIMHQGGCNEVVYLGGEPTIHPHLFHILNYAASLGMSQCIVSNGQVIDEQFAKQLSKIRNFEIGISLHSCDESIQNNISGNKTSFEGIIRGIRALEKYEIPWYSQTSLIKANYLELNQLQKFLIGCGRPTRMDLSRMVIGTHSSDQFLTEVEYIKVFEQINHLDTKKLPVRIEAFPRCWLKRIADEHDLNYAKLKATVRPCYAWTGQISIDIHGNVRLCPTGGKVAGNILESGLDGVWGKNRVIRDFQTFQWQRSECLVCDDFAFCVGACKMSCGTSSPMPDCYIVEGGMTNACSYEG